MIIDAWAQHPTLRHAQDLIFDSLRRWNRQEAPSEQPPVKSTIDKMDEAIAVATKHENVYIDTSAYTVSRYPEQLLQYMKTNGRGKVLFGTNYPMITPEKTLKGLSGLGLDPDILGHFLGKNAQQVFAIAN